MKTSLDLGMSILDLSKVHMHSFYYDVLKGKGLMFSKLQTLTDDIYEDWR